MTIEEHEKRMLERSMEPNRLPPEIRYQRDVSFKALVDWLRVAERRIVALAFGSEFDEEKTR